MTAEIGRGWVPVELLWHGPKLSVDNRVCTADIYMDMGGMK